MNSDARGYFDVSVSHYLQYKRIPSFRYYLQPELMIKHEPEETIIDVIEPYEIENNYEASSKPYTCEYCDGKFSSKTTLNVHIKGYCRNKTMKSSGNTKPFVGEYCDQCDKYCRNVKYHMNSFHQGKSFSCDLCNFSTKYVANLVSHKKVSNCNIVNVWSAESIFVLET
jgi:hypothetical protein